MSEPDNKSWICPYCLVPNLPQNENCRSCKKVRTTAEELLEKNSKVEDRFAHGFLAVFLVLGIAATVGMKINPLVAAAGLLACWWFGLALFASQPASGNFLRTRKVAADWIAEARTENTRKLLHAAFRFLYWPIFVSKDVYFWLIMTLGGLWFFFSVRHGN